MKEKDKQILRLIKKYSKKDASLKVLDVGAGSPVFKGILPKNMSYKTLDIDPKNKPDILCDLNKKLPVKKESYDIIICSEVLEHTLNPLKIAKEIKRITKKEGLIIMTLPNEYNLYLRLKFLFGIPNNTETPFREDLWMNHIHKARVRDIIEFYKKLFNIKEITYSWDSFSGSDIGKIIDPFIRIFLKPISKNLFARSVLMAGTKK